MIWPDISPGFCALIFILAWYQWELCLCFLIGVCFHELGHLAMLRYRGVQILGIQLRLRGVVIKAGEMDYRTEILCALAGPVFSGILGVVLLRIWPLCSLVSFGLCVLNMLPMVPLDGGRILRAMLLLHLNIETADQVMRFCAYIVAGILMVGACWITVWLQAGLWPIFAALVMLWRAGETEK